MPLDSMQNVSDDALMVLYANGDASAAGELARRHAPKVLSHAFRLVGVRAEAEDITQEVLLKLWRIAPQWRQGEAKVSTWLYRVTGNLCIDARRKGHRSDVGIDQIAEPMDDSPSAADRLQEAARLDALNVALQSLPERQRQAVVLRHIEGLTNPEIAEILEIGVEAVESLTARAKRALSAALAGRKAELGFEND